MCRIKGIYFRIKVVALESVINIIFLCVESKVCALESGVKVTILSAELEVCVLESCY